MINDDERISDSVARITFGTWSGYRTEQLFWWRVPVVCKAATSSLSRSVLPIIHDFER